VKMAVLWDIAPCSLVEVYRRFGDAYYLHHQGDETSVNFYQTTRRNIPEEVILDCSSFSRSQISTLLLEEATHNSLCKCSFASFLVSFEFERLLICTSKQNESVKQREILLSEVKSVKFQKRCIHKFLV
jgi:hypothetical protein